MSVTKVKLFAANKVMLQVIVASDYFVGLHGFIVHLTF